MLLQSASIVALFSPGAPSRSLKRCVDSGNLDSANLPQTLTSFPNLFDLPIDTNGTTVWHIATERNDLQLLRSLHELFSKHTCSSKPSRPFSKPDKQGKTALHIACARGDDEAVQLLLSWGALPLQERDKKGRLPMHLAARYGRHKVIKLLLQDPQALPSSSGSGSAEDAAITYEEVATAAAHPAQQQRAPEYSRMVVRLTDGYGLTPLHYASAANSSDSCKLLLEAGAPLLATSTTPCHKNNMPCNAGMTALHVAAMNNALEAAEILLKAWVDMPLPERLAEWTPSSGPSGSRAALTDLRAICDKEGKTAYMVAANRRCKSLVKILDPSTPLPLPDLDPAVKPPVLFCCPITMELMQDPAVVSDGFTYERAAIDKWLSVHKTSPMTNLPLEQKGVFPNHAMRQAINDWRAEQGMSEVPTLAVPAGAGAGASVWQRDGFLQDVAVRPRRGARAALTAGGVSSRIAA